MRSISSILISVFTACILVLAPGLRIASTAVAHPHIVKVGEGIEIPTEDLLADLAGVQVVFIGELHDHVGHHQAQLSIIRALAGRETPLAIGLEMFRHDSQQALDQWVAGDLSLGEFLPIYHDNWSMWREYRPIFEFARRTSTRMIGLNISREITRKVARSGFASLAGDQRRLLGNVQCVVDPAYADYIRRAMGGHGGHGDSFLFFCEAQLLWDTMMARMLVEFLRENPDYRVVVLTGSAHAWKFGIPRQMLEQADLSYRVILPEIFGRVDRQSVHTEIADYLWLDVGDDGWQF